MRLLGLDFETTGLDTLNDRIIEVGVALWCTESKKYLIATGSFVKTDVPISEEASLVNGITQEMVTEFGTTPDEMLTTLDLMCLRHKVDYIVAHNGENFDKPMLYSAMKRSRGSYPILENIDWIDTRTDIPFPTEPSSRKLNHLAADHGFINHNKHRALFDVTTMMQVLACYDIEKVLAYQKIPFITLQAVVGYEDRQLAKDARFSWEAIGDKRYPKMWVKRVKQNLLELERTKCKFEIRELSEK